MWNPDYHLDTMEENSEECPELARVDRPVIQSQGGGVDRTVDTARRPEQGLNSNVNIVAQTGIDPAIPPPVTQSRQEHNRTIWRWTQLRRQ
jgi:hypothetical protein